MALSPEEVADLNRQARRRAERAAAEMSFHGVSSEDYLKKLRAKRRPTRRFEVGDIPAAVEIESDEDTPPAQPQRSASFGRAFRQSPQGVPRSSTAKRTSAPPAPRMAPRTSDVLKAPARQRAHSHPDLLYAGHQPSTTTLGSLTFAVPTNTSRSTLGTIDHNKAVRRAASVAPVPSKSTSVESEGSRPGHQTKPSRSRSVQVGTSPSDVSLPRGSLVKRSSLRSLKDKIRRVASAFELRSRDESETGDGITLQHNKSTRSLLRYSATRIRRRRLEVVKEEA